MKAVLVKEPGGIEQLVFGEAPKPVCGPDDILVRVHATALNRADILQREGKYPPPEGASPILGLEMAGVVEEAGERCRDRWKPGDRVMALLSGGGYAEYAVVPGDMAMRIPDGMSFEQAAAIPEAFLTAWQCLFWIAGLKRGETVLIHAGASGVGTAAIQLARSVGTVPVVTAGSGEKRRFCLELGAVAAADYKAGNWDEAILEATGGQGVDAVMDFVGAPYWKQHLRLLKPDGRWVLISFLGGSRLEQISLAPLLSKRIQLTGTTLRSRSVSYKARLTGEFAAYALPRFGSGELRPVIDSVFPWEEVREAHRRMEENRNKGKIVLNVKRCP